MNNGLTNGNQMVGASFTSIGALKDGKPCMLLTQLAPTGYEDNEDMKSDTGTWGDFSFQIRKTNGKADNTYQWFQDYDENDGWLPGCWHWFEGNQDIGSENDVKFFPGDGFWFSVGNDYGKIDGALKNAGEAIVDAQSVAIVSGKNKGIAVPVSFDVKLYAGKVRPAGYENDEDMKIDGGTWGDFSFQVLKTNGKSLRTYQWFQDYLPDQGGWQEGCWHDFEGNQDIGAENDVTLKAGQGLWFSVGSDYGPFDAPTLEFPGIDE